jgi:hypothetical protein
MGCCCPDPCPLPPDRTQTLKTPANPVGVSSLAKRPVHPAHLSRLTNRLRGQASLQQGPRTFADKSPPTGLVPVHIAVAALLNCRSALARDGGRSGRKVIADTPPSRASLAPTGLRAFAGKSAPTGSVSVHIAAAAPFKVGADSSAKGPVNPAHSLRQSHRIRGQVPSHWSCASPYSGSSTGQL